MRFNEQVLMFESQGEISPTTFVKSIKEAKITRGTEGDEVEIQVLHANGKVTKKSLAYGKSLPLSIVEGRVRARRVSGDGPITLILFQN